MINMLNAANSQMADAGRIMNNATVPMINIQRDVIEQSVKTQKTQKTQEMSMICNTCSERRYADVSNDPGVSFQTPTKINAAESFSAVRSHEQEHITRNRLDAEENDREVLYEKVSYQTASCPECGKIYMSGGQTSTVTKAKPGTNLTLEEELVGMLFDDFA